MFKKHCGINFIRGLVIGLSLLLLPGCLFKNKKNNNKEDHSVLEQSEDVNIVKQSEDINMKYLNKNQVLELGYIYIPFVKSSFLIFNNDDFLFVSFLEKETISTCLNLIKEIIKSQGYMLIKEYSSFNSNNHIFYIKNPLRKINIVLEEDLSGVVISQVIL